MRPIIIALAMLTAAACSDAQSSLAALKAAGYSNIAITGWEPFSCGQDDTFSTGFTADNPKGERVRGVVCCGLMFKACTIRH